MRRVLLLGVMTTTLSAPIAGAATWSIGSHVTLVSVRGDDNDGSSTVVGFPANTLAYQPGLRVGVGDVSRAHEVVVDAGLLAVEQGGSSLSQLGCALGYQHALRPQQAVAFFANLSIGFYREGGAGGAGSNLTYGGGIGIRRRVAEGRGRVRGEVRLDRLEADRTVGRPMLKLMGLRLGFDPWP